MKPTPKRRLDGEGSFFITKNNGVPVMCFSETHWDEDGRRRFIRGFAQLTPTQRQQVLSGNYDVDDFREAKHQARLKQRENVNKRLLAPPKERRTTPTLTAFLDTYLTSRQKEISPESFRKYRRDFENHILPHIGSLTLEELNAEILHELFYVILADTGTSAREHCYTNLTAVLNQAYRLGIIERNPLNAVRKPRHRSPVVRDDRKWINKRISISKGMLNWLAEEDNPLHEHYYLVLFMFLGLRRAELLGIEWSCINQLHRRGKASLRVQQQLSRYEKHEEKSGWYIKKHPKNEEDRIIYLPERWRKALVKMKKEAPETSSDWYANLVFLRPNGKHYTYNAYYKVWRKVLTAYYNKSNTEEVKELQPSEYFRPHYMRHIAASILFDEGVSIEIAQSILGHMDGAMTLYYTHLTKDNRKSAMASLEQGTSPKK